MDRASSTSQAGTSSRGSSLRACLLLAVTSFLCELYWVGQDAEPLGPARIRGLLSGLALGLALASAAIGLAARVRVASEGAALVALTSLFGLGVPAVIFFVSGTLGGIPQNASATLAFLFPLGMTMVVLRGDAAVRARDVARPARSL